MINSQHSSIAHIEFKFYTKFATLMIPTPVKFPHILDQNELSNHKENIQSDFKESIMLDARETWRDLWMESLPQLSSNNLF